MNKTSRTIANITLGAGIGAGAMYFFDPKLGKKRRSRVRDQIIHAYKASSDYLSNAFENIGNRTTGLYDDIKERLSGQPVDDIKLAERVRYRINRILRHPAFISVLAHDGEIVLRGPILDKEVETLLRYVRSVRGVHRIQNELEVHDRPETLGELKEPKTDN